MSRATRRWTLPALAALLAAATSGCGNPTVDTATIEKGIKDQVTAGGTSVTDVSCPDDVQSNQGATFKCGVTFANGATGKVQVTEVKRAHYQYTLVPGSVQVPGSVLEDEIKTQLKQAGAPNASVNCPDNVIVKVGTYVVCEVKGAKGGSGTVKFTFSDAGGTVDESSVSAS